MSLIKVAIHGAGGRMGRRLVALGSQDPQLTVAAAIENPAHPALGQDAGSVAGVSPLGIAVVAQWPSQIDVAIDFSSPEGCSAALQHCASARVPLVIATTGLSNEQIATIHQTASRIPICWAPNMS